MYLKVNVAGTSTSHQDKLTGTEHTLLPEATNKKEQNIWNNSYQTLGIKQQMTVILERWEINEVSPMPMIVPAYYMERISILWHKERKPSPSLTEFLSW